MKNFDVVIKDEIDKYRKAENKHISEHQINDVVKIFTNSKYINSINMNSISVEGMGGNGIVFKYIVDGIPFCIKCLYNRYDNREHRFHNEIDAMKKLTGTKGVVPILYDGHDEEQKQDYFIMPYFEKYVINSKDIGFKERIEDMIQLAKIIKSIHTKEGINAHRDIKLENIFKQDGIMYLSDFGLVKFDDDRENITKYERRIGPWNISPPEFYSKKLRNQLKSYDISDVYLFAKVVWQVLKGDEIGFWGAYIDNVDNFIDIDEIREKYSTENIISIEPINEMIINTTSNSLSYRQKFNIDYCIECLGNELKKIDNNSKKAEYDDKINNLMFFQNNAQMAVSLEDEKAVSVIKEVIQDECSIKEIRSLNPNIINPIYLSVEIFDYDKDKNIITINDKYKTIFLGEVRLFVVDNLRKNIIIKFAKSSNKDYEAIYDSIEKYRQFGENKKYLLDKDCELQITFNDKYIAS